MSTATGSTSMELNSPSWFHDAEWLKAKKGLRVAVCESRGKNSFDLMAAIYLATLDNDTVLNLQCFDDKRDSTTATSLAKKLASDGVQVVIGHFAAIAAMSAARIYDENSILFLAPGCSDPMLCSSGGPGTYAIRFFGNDTEQMECLISAIPEQARVRIFAQIGNYGYRLGKALHQRLSVHASSSTIDFLHVNDKRCRSRMLANDLVLIAGSSEFASCVAKALPFAEGQTLLLTDDCRLDLAAELKLCSHTRVATLDCDLSSSNQTRFAKLIERAKFLIGRPPGPYFLTSYLACEALCVAISESSEKSTDYLRSSILRQSISSPYGMLEFDSAGNLQGHTWLLKTAPKYFRNDLEEEVPYDRVF
ncbi:hypothetical protein I9H06_00345 [Pseudomonas tremae]|uniref:hypothetical protein n=1 Tax=Pseudomonas tremae TaxID=200454 RepID=UPI001F1DBD82|nr:hypothetical protein [Pseudomonas tremae]MCF5714922.1 hypothetical protein [Pseudomonas tremae]UQB31811.1 hypothetical protein I9H06_00345 [Pseudomonas tremae]